MCLIVIVCACVCLGDSVGVWLIVCVRTHMLPCLSEAGTLGGGVEQDLEEEGEEVQSGVTPATRLWGNAGEAGEGNTPLHLWTNKGMDEEEGKEEEA